MRWRVCKMSGSTGHDKIDVGSIPVYEMEDVEHGNLDIQRIMMRPRSCITRQWVPRFYISAGSKHPTVTYHTRGTGMPPSSDVFRTARRTAFSRHTRTIVVPLCMARSSRSCSATVHALSLSQTHLGNLTVAINDTYLFVQADETRLRP